MHARLLLAEEGLVAQLEGLANGGHDVVRHVPAVEHVHLTHVARVLGNIADDVVVLILAARCKADARHDVVCNDLQVNVNVARESERGFAVMRRTVLC